MCPLDWPAYILWSIGVIFQSLAREFSTHYFKMHMIPWSEFAEKKRLQELQNWVDYFNEETADKWHLTAKKGGSCSNSHSISMVAVWRGNSCLVEGTVEECMSYVDGMLMMLAMKGK